MEKLIIKKVGVIGLILIFVAFTAFGDTVLLKDGRIFKGNIVEETDEFVRILSEGKVKRISHSLIDKIFKGEVEEKEFIEEQTIKKENTFKRNNYSQGLIDGERNGTEASSRVWLAGGFFLLIVGFIGSLILVPNPSAEALVGKSPEYIEGYTKGFKSSARSKNSEYAAIGCISSIIIGSVVLVGIAFIEFVEGDWTISLNKYLTE